MTLLHNDIQMNTSSHVSVNILAFVEDTPQSFIPRDGYIYETILNESSNYNYKDKPILEKVILFIYYNRDGFYMIIYVVWLGN